MQQEQLVHWVCMIPVELGMISTLAQFCVDMLIYHVRWNIRATALQEPLG